MLRMMEEMVTRLQTELAAEKRDRDQMEENLLRLLEQTCAKVNVAQNL